jgi:ankyrin repeat protein
MDDGGAEVAEVTDALSKSQLKNKKKRAKAKQQNKDALALPAASAATNAAFFQAVYHGQVAQVKTFLAEGVRTEQYTQGFSPLALACDKAYIAVAEALLVAGAPVDVSREDGGASPLVLACIKEQIDVVALLLVHKADTEMSDADGDTPLAIAVQGQHVGLVATLLKHKADPNAKNPNSGASPLYVAALLGLDTIVAMLLKFGADAGVMCDQASAYPIHAACWNGHVAVARRLLDSNVDVDLRTEQEATPLFIACQNDHSEVVELLLARHAQLEVRTDDGATPLFIARTNELPHIEQLLLAAGAMPLKENGSNGNVLDFPEYQKMKGVVLSDCFDAEERCTLEALGQACLTDEARKRHNGPTHASDVHCKLYLHAGRRIQLEQPTLYAKLFEVARRADAQEWHLLDSEAVKGRDLTARVVEYHTYTVGGGLTNPEHYDEDSLLTCVLMLADPLLDYEGGQIQTFEADGHFESYALRPGDCLVFPSHKFHSVTPVTQGCRRNIVVEFWLGPEGTTDARLIFGMDPPDQEAVGANKVHYC